MAKVLLGLGSNLGDREAFLRRALERLRAAAVRVLRISSLYETDPVGHLEQGRFLNAVALAETSLEPRDLLGLTQSIERGLGRVQTDRWGPRVVDMDILSYDHLILDDPDLKLPHPRLAERAFVLVPLAEIAPEWRHPRLRSTAQELLAALGTVRGVDVIKQNWVAQ